MFQMTGFLVTFNVNEMKLVDHMAIYKQFNMIPNSTDLTTFIQQKE